MMIGPISSNSLLVESYLLDYPNTMCAFGKISLLLSAKKRLGGVCPRNAV
jgi:hypothetical protein